MGLVAGDELDGPQEFYLILIDNGRSKILADGFMRQSLSCIRCGACLNVCPVYQTIGGHAYGSTYQGPLGAMLTPLLTSVSEAPEHCLCVVPVRSLSRSLSRRHPHSSNPVEASGEVPE